MTEHDKIKSWICGVLSTMAELDQGTPESMVYIALGMNMEDYNTVKRILLDIEAVEIEFNYITLTAKGRKMGDAINASLAK